MNTASVTNRQQKMKATLEKAGIPFKAVACYGNQIVITSYSLDAANKWAALLGSFAKVRGITESYDEAVKNNGTCLKPTMVHVYRTFARI